MFWLFLQVYAHEKDGNVRSSIASNLVSKYPQSPRETTGNIIMKDF